MHNMAMIIGRLVEEPTEQEKGLEIKLKVIRDYKNEKGEYESDIFPVMVFGHIAEMTKEYIKPGNYIGIKGRLETKGDKIEIIAEKVTFLSDKQE